MATMSSNALRRFAGLAIVLLLFGTYVSGQARANRPMGTGGSAVPPGSLQTLVTASSPSGLTHPTGWGGILQTAITPNGDWLVVDWVNSSLYEFPAGSNASVDIVPPQSLGSKQGYQNPIILLDPANNLYLGGNWNNCLLEFNYNPSTNTWPTLSALSSSTNSASLCGTAPYNLIQYGAINSFSPNYIQPWGIALGTHNNIILGNQDGPNFIFSADITGAWSSPSVATGGAATHLIIGKMTKRPNSIAVDPEGNIYFVEDSNGLSGVYEIPANAPIPLASDADPSIVRVDANLPTAIPGVTTAGNLPSVAAVVTDAAGNLYISDSTAGIYVIPNPLGVLNPAGAYQLSSVPSTGEIAIDWTRGIVYTPTSQKQSNGQADVASIGMTHAEFGSSNVGTKTSTPVSVSYSFNGAVTPDRAVIVENGGASSDFAFTPGGICNTNYKTDCILTDQTTGAYTSYSVGQSTSLGIIMTPHTVGSISATLLLQKSDPVSSSDKDYSDPIAGFSQSASVLTLYTCAPSATCSKPTNNLVPGEAIVISASGATDPLHALDGEELYVSSLLTNTNNVVVGFTVNTSTLTSGASGDNNKSQNTTAATIQARTFTTLNSFVLHGVGVAPLIQAGTIPAESAIGNALVTPTQVAVDGTEAVYVADAGQPNGRNVLKYVGSNSGGWTATATSIGSGLVAPTGVAVDGTGNVYIADSSNGTIYEIPALPSDGLNTNPGQFTLATGLGANLRLAVDGSSNLYIADPSNGRIVKLSDVGSTGPGLMGQVETIITTGLTAPTAVTVDSNNNLYVIDGANLLEFLNGGGSPVTLSSSLSGATGIAVDPSGALYISGAGGTMRVPYVSGAYAFGSPTAIAATVTGPSAVALDQWGNIFLADTTTGAMNVHLVTTSGTLTFAPFTTPGQSGSLSTTVTNIGNASLNVKGYTASLFYVVNNTQNPRESVTVQDFYPADGTCVSSSPVAVGANCQMQITMQPGPGEEGPLSAQEGFTGNAANSPIISVSGVGAPLPKSQTTPTVVSTSEVINSTVNVTVAPKSGSGIPQGEVALTYTSFYVDTPAATGVPTIEQNQITLTQQLDSTGKATFTVNPAGLAPVDYGAPQPFMAGAQNLSVVYVGDPAYAFGRSTATPAASIAKSHIQGLMKDTNPPPYLPFVLEGGQVSGSIPYDGTQTYWQYSMPLTVATALGTPTGTITFNDNSTTCPTGTSATGQGPAICALTGYSGVACPLNPQVITVRNAGVANTARASFTASCLPMPLNTTYTPVISTHFITPAYSGDANYISYQGNSTYNPKNWSDPAADSYMFQALRSPMVLITAPSQNGDPTAPVALTVGNGSSVSTTLTVTSLLGYGFAGKGGQLNDYNFPVSLACDNLPPHAACTFTYPTTVNAAQPSAPNSVQIPCTGTSGSAADCVPGVVTLILTTNVTVGTTTSQNAAFASITLASLFGFGMVGIFFRRKAFEKGRKMLIVLLLVVGGALTACLTACSTTNLSPNAVLNSPSGTYAMTVTADQVGSQTISLPTGPVQVYGSENQVSVPFVINVTVQ